VRLRDYFVTRDRYGLAILHSVPECSWMYQSGGRALYLDELMDLIAKHDEDCPCAEG
jgi:hypothetical protein